MATHHATRGQPRIHATLIQHADCIAKLNGAVRYVPIVDRVHFCHVEGMKTVRHSGPSAEPLSQRTPCSNLASRQGRRAFISLMGSSALLVACGSGTNSSDGAGGNGGGASSAGGMGGTGGVAGMGGAGGTGGAGGSPASTSTGPMVCTPSDDNILGPYYRANAPFRDDLTEPNMAGTIVTVSGRVLTQDCQPIANALLDVWQADDTGDYDNDGVNDPPPGVFILRGRLNADASGNYSFRTIIPGHYLNGSQFRPAHVHVIVSAPGFASLTTQLYFEGDPYNDNDPFIVDSLIMPVEDQPNGEKASPFDFVLAPA